MEKCITDKIGEYFKIFMEKKMPAVKPEEEKEDEEKE
jgi:hypothetical protein